jgi:hypothetical protein
MTVHERIAALARRVENDQFFLASALADYARSEELDEGGLATVLDCSIDTLNRLRLCRRPRPAGAEFQADLTGIAARFGLKADTLAQIVRRADVLVALRRGSASESGLLAAARDRDEPIAGESGAVDGVEKKP